ncbi:MAG: hypothetical protein O2936_11515 [Proteobacteria bacterium]|nr:hypothetical protein [Pseudomonadota bacterium]
MKTFFRWINPLVIGLLRSRVHGLLSFQLMVLDITGRRTGKQYSLPVSFAADGKELVCLTLASNIWWKNFIDRPKLTIWYRGRQHSAEASVESQDVERIEKEIKQLIEHNFADAFFAGIRLNLKLEPNPKDLARAATRHVVLRVRPLDGIV